MQVTGGASREQRFLRPGRRGVRRRAPGARTARLLGVALVAAAAVASVPGARLAWRWLNSRPELRVRHVDVRGALRVSPALLASLTQELGRTSILAVRLGTLEARLRQGSPWVRSATVRRVLPRTIAIEIDEFVPVARLDSAPALVGPDGRLLPREPALAGDELLPALVAGPDSPARARGLRDAVRLVELLEAGHHPLAHRVRGLDLTDPSDLVLRLVDASYAVHVGSSDFASRLNRFCNVEPVLNARYEGLEKVDLRYQDRVIVSPVRDSGRDLGPASATSGG